MVGLILFCSVWVTLATRISAQQYFIVAPNIIRVDVEESILINLKLKGVPEDAVVPVTLYFQMAGSDERLSETIVEVNGDPTVTHNATMRVHRAQLPVLESTGDKAITLVAQANSPFLSFDDRQSILLSLKSGYVFIQTDKPLYTPSQRVNIRIIALNQKMFPDMNLFQVDIVSPDKIIVHRSKKTAMEGFATEQFDFPPVPVFGKWTVTVYYGHLFKSKTSVEFEVKEYVLPKFQVTVQTDKEYVLPETENLVTTVTAMYVFGERVYGKFLLKYGFYTDDDNISALQEKEGTLGENGIGREALTVGDIRVDLETLMGKRLVIQAYVTDVATGETINADNTRVTFTRTPYKFNWDSTPRYFKKGMPFAVKASVQYINGLPASDVPVTISATARLSGGALSDLVGHDENSDNRNSGPDGEVFFRQDVPSDATEVTLHLETKDGTLNEANTESTFTLRPEESAGSAGDEFLLIRIPMGEVEQIQQIGSFSPTEVLLTHHQGKAHLLHFFVISGGKIVYESKRETQNANTAFEFQITHKMAPVSRIVAYYINSDNQVIADALLIRVQEICQNPIDVIFEERSITHSDNTFKSDGKEKGVKVKVTAEPDTKVGLLAVDEAVFALRKNHRLTQKKVFERMAGYDLGCGPGGGQSAPSIFKDAGVVVMTNALLNVVPREEIECPQAVQRVRRMSEEEHNQTLDEYEGEERKYCKMGLRDVTDPESFPCIRRAKLLSRREDLSLRSSKVEAFYDCCRRKERTNHGRSGVNEDLDLEVDMENAVLRSNFPESWLFFELKTEDDGSKSRGITLPDSVTTWVVEAMGVSVSNEYLMCVAEPVKLQVRPPFFLELALPYSVKRMEQIEIIVSVFNYAEVELPVTVALKGAEGLCSEAQPGEFSEGKTINVLPNRPGVVKFVIIPLEVKRIPIEVSAVTNSSEMYKDAIVKFLNVYQEGYLQRDTATIIVDPVNSRLSQRRVEQGGKNQSFQHIQMWGEDGENSQTDVIRYNLKGDAIPGTHKVFISLMGNMMGNVIETVLGGLDKLLKIPSGCAEQTMLSLAPNVYIYRYLKHSEQFTDYLEEAAGKFIENGVARELTFRRPDGSFACFGHTHSHPSSTWLTAFVSKVFCQAKEFALIDDVVTCKAVEWLIETSQEVDGSFREVSRVLHQEMIGSVQGKVSMTAFVLISLLECECATVDTSNSVALATAFLEGKLVGLTRPYAIAITAYALTLANSNKADEALVKLKEIAMFDRVSNSRYWGLDDSSYGDGPKPFWYSSQPQAIEVETTSYALLAILQLDDMPYSHPIVNWLTNQENYEGGFVSTQDTVVALHALSAYSIKSQMNVIDMNCHVNCQEADFSKDFLLKHEDAIVKQFAKIIVPEDRPEFQVTFDSAGTGMGQLKFESSYSIPEPNADNCDFVLDINQVANEDNDQIEYTIELSYLKGEATTMAILDVGLYTGYKAVKKDLDEVKLNSGGNVQLIEETDLSVVFYLDEILRDRVEVITFQAEQKFKVAKLQPVVVKVYDYYNPTVECSKFIHPEEGLAQLSLLCFGETCSCATGKCALNPNSDHRTFQVNQLVQEACTSASHFAFEAEVVSTKRSGSFQVISMTILTSVKQGLDPVAKNEIRTFWKSESCEEPKLLKRRYLVIGSGGIPFKSDVGDSSFKYVIDEKMSFYEWPTVGGSRDLTRNRWSKLKGKLDEVKVKLSEGGGCPT